MTDAPVENATTRSIRFSSSRTLPRHSWPRRICIASCVSTGTGFPLSTRYSTEIILISWLVNCVVPAKLGDVYRAYLLRVNYLVSLSTSFGTIVIERVFDLIAIVLMGLVAGYWSFRSGLSPEVQAIFLVGIAVVVLLGAGGTILAIGYALAVAYPRLDFLPTMLSILPVASLIVNAFPSMVLPNPAIYVMQAVVALGILVVAWTRPRAYWIRLDQMVARIRSEPDQSTPDP